MRRWLVLKEETETAWCPWWYPIFAAAEECHCTPWEMLDAPVFWRDKAIIKRTAENQARKILEDHK